MLLTVTPNLCIERTISLSSFTPGQVHRVPADRLQVNAGGKGINAARVATRLGCASLATAWVGRRQKEWFEEQLTQESVAHDLVEVEADTRVCVNVLSGGSNGWTKTEIVEAGNALSVSDGTKMLEKFTALLPQADLVAICGSYPPAADAAFDAHLALLVQVARRAGKRVLVDGKGRAFEMALRSRTPPWAVKPNLEEASALLQRTIETPAEERRAVRDILRMGVDVILLSCGERGAYLGTTQGVWFLHAPSVAEISPVGSGDAFVGAFCAQHLATNDLLLAARWGVAAGAANAMQSASAFCSAAEIEELVLQVKIQMAELRLQI